MRMRQDQKMSPSFLFGLLGMLFLLVVTFGGIRGRILTRSASSIRLSALTESETNSLIQCRSAIYASDRNKDRLMSKEEYASFVDSMSHDQIETGFEDLDLIFVLIFYTVACQDCHDSTQDPHCCVGKDVSVAFNRNDSTDEKTMISFICTQVQAALEKGALRTEIPESKPTPAPTLKSSFLLTGHPPSFSPSDQDSQIPSALPSQLLKPSSKPSPHPTSFPTPTHNCDSKPIQQACVTFGYTLENKVGLTAPDILSGNQNSLKLGLEIATENITIAILNTTYPRPEDPLQTIPPHNETSRRHLVRDHRAFQLGLSDFLGLERTRQVLENITSESDVYSLSRLLRGHLATSRQLAIYTVDIPPQILNIMDNPYCPQGEKDGVTLCSTVETRVCVVLEEKDSEWEVDFTILRGFREAVNDGSFWKAIPPEHDPSFNGSRHKN